MPTLLIVDDESNLRYSLEKGLSAESLRVLSAGTGQQGVRMVTDNKPDAVILDICLPDISGLEVFDQVRAFDPRLPVIILTAHGTTETAIEAMKRGAFEYLLKPVDLHQLRELVSRAIDLSRSRHVPAVFDQEATRPDALGNVDRIVGRSAAMQQVYKTIGRLAIQNIPVLITGESGTGKELVARALYQHSDRREHPYLAINCAALPETLLESELFGHEKGAFTGADNRRIGKFEQAHGGTILLDEIGDMSPATQAKVLRLLQDQTFQRVGGNETIQTDVRILAATNKNLAEMVTSGKFRSDLYYRLNTFIIALPPLRERIEDLPLLVDYFLRRLAPQLGKPQVTSMTEDAFALLRQHRWPGNVRELQNIVRYALVHATGEVLDHACLPASVQAASTTTVASDGKGTDVIRLVRDLLHAGETEIYRRVCAAVDEAVLNEILRHTAGNQVQASELLGISRTTLRAKMRALGLDRQE